MSLRRAAVRRVLTALHRLRKHIWRLRGQRPRGVLAVPLTPEGKLVLVRLTYAPGWRLPGGGVGSGEGLEAAALRELREEIGMTGCGAVTPIDEFDHGPGDRGLSTLFLVRDVVYTPRRSFEVEEVAEFDTAALPSGATPLTRAKLALARPLID